mgnify:CR=1 FL=1
MDVDAPWAGPVEFGPGNNTATNSWNLCPGIPHTVIGILRSSDGAGWLCGPGPDGATNHDCRINFTVTLLLSLFAFTVTLR